MKNTKQTYNEIKKNENGDVFIQFKKGGKFVKVDKDLAAFVIFAGLQK